MLYVHAGRFLSPHLVSSFLILPLRLSCGHRCVQKDPRLAKMRPLELHEIVRLRVDFKDEFLARYIT